MRKYRYKKLELVPKYKRSLDKKKTTTIIGKAKLHLQFFEYASFINEMHDNSPEYVRHIKSSSFLAHFLENCRQQVLSSS